MNRTQFVRVLLCATVAAVLASCSSDGTTPGQPAASTPTRHEASGSPTVSGSPTGSGTPGPSGASRSPTASSAPSLPAAADGTDTGACADGRCEVRVKGGESVPLSGRHGIDYLHMNEIKARKLTLAAQFTKSIDTDGGCGGTTIIGGSAAGPPVALLTCQAGDEAVLNGLDIEIVGIVGHAAVLRLRPAEEKAPA